MLGHRDSKALSSEALEAAAEYRIRLRDFLGLLADAFAIDDEQPVLDVLDRLLETDKRLHGLLAHMQSERNELDLIADAQAELENVNARLAATIESTYEGCIQLEESIAAARHLLRRSEQSVSKPIDIGTVRTLAQRFSTTMRAPHHWKPGMPLGLHRPPYPTEDMIRASALFQLMGQSKDPSPSPPAIEPPAERVQKTENAAETLPAKPFLDLDLNPDLL